MRRAVFLDRDGTLNEPIIRNGRAESPLTLGELVVMPDVPEGLAALRKAGFILIVATNQPNVPRGVQSRADVQEMNEVLAARLGLDDFRVCWHDDADACECRKPKPGLLREAALERGVDLSRSFMIGDRWRDIGAGRAAGCRTVLIDHRYEEDCPIEPDARVNTFLQAARWVLATTGLSGRE